MTGLALVLALAVGQVEANALWLDHSVRVIAGNGLGSGTILGSDPSGKELVITAGHVIAGRRSGLKVRYRGETYPARYLAGADDGDMAALETDVPGTVGTLAIADRTPRTAAMLGYGGDGRLCVSHGKYLTDMTRSGDQTPDHAYSFHAESGDSGGGVFSDDGKFAGVVWGSVPAFSMASSVAKTHKFLGVRVQQTSGGSRSLVIFPFWWSKRTWTDSSPAASGTCPNGNCGSGSRVVVTPSPVAPPPPGGVAVTAPGVAVQVGPQGIQGPAGKDGQNGKDADPTQLAALTAKVDQLTANMGKITNVVAGMQAQPSTDLGPLTARIAALENATKPLPPPIVLRFTKPDGTSTLPRTFSVQTDPSTGQQAYAIELNPGQLGPQTVPVTPLPKS